VTEHLGGTLSIALLDKCTRVYPAECDCAKVIPSVPLERPDAGETKYFAYHGCKELVIGGSIVDNSSCGGRFCDRQIPAGSTPGTVVACGCFHRRDKYKIVSEHSLRIPCTANVNEHKWVTVSYFRSLRFDELLFQDGSQRIFDSIELGDPIANRVLRNHVSRLVKLVNDRHGWTIVGWVRTGLVKDVNEEGNRDAEDIAAEDVRPHVTYLYPTDPSDVDPNKTEDYKNVRITEDAFRKEMKEEEQRLNQEKRKRKQS